jgi:hypothetical protein
MDADPDLRRIDLAVTGVRTSLTEITGGAVLRRIRRGQRNLAAPRSTAITASARGRGYMQDRARREVGGHCAGR